jgi:hypothetical protein
MDALVGVIGRGHSVWSRLRAFPYKRHMSRFESCSFDRNYHLNVLIHALEWSDAPIKIDRTRLDVRSPLIRVADHAIGRAAWTDRTPQCQRPVDSSKLPLTTWRVRSIVTGRATAFDRPFAFIVPLVPDQTRRSLEWPDAPVINPSHTPDCCCHWPDVFGHTETTSGHLSDLRSPPFLSTMT